ncbi:tape measure protein [Pseudomonas citronellolis]|uniref:tape measure protein n=1 Tax=Pseudomonas citronellolis TaxID=53408 RepID=UPI0023E3A79A|nr:tape measure protein [Pseudomonas citronellolis]MDF3932151.1 tape measure protein [Pseudomonas citronellolis]
MTDIEVRLGADVDGATRNVGSFRSEWQKLVKEVEKPLRQVNSFRTLEDELDKGQRAAERARDRVRELGDELARTASPSKDLQTSYRAATAELQKMERAEVQQRVRLASMRAELQGAGIDTRNLAAEQQRLRGELNQRVASGAADAALNQARGALGVGNIQSAQQSLVQLRQQYQLLSKDGNLSSKELAEAQATYRRSVDVTLGKLRQLRAALSVEKAGAGDQDAAALRTSQVSGARSALGVGQIEATQRSLVALRQQYQLLSQSGDLSAKELSEAQATYRKSVDATLAKLRQLRTATAAPQSKTATSIQDDLAASFAKISNARDAFGITAIKEQQRELINLRGQYGLLRDSGVLSSRDLAIAQANYRDSVSASLAKLRDLRAVAAAPVAAPAADPSLGLNQAMGNLGIDRLRQLQAQLKSLPEDYDRLAKAGFRSAQEQVAAQAQLQRQLGETRAAIKDLSVAEQGGGSIGFLGKLGTAAVVGYSVTELVGAYVRSADGLRKMNGQLRLATEGQEEFNAAQRALSQQADDYQAPLNGLYTLYSRLSPAMRDANKSQAELLGVSEAVTASMKISGATAEESENSIIQFAQALGAGALRGDEFNSVAEQSPRLMRALADGLGVSRSALKGMADAGQLTTTVVVNGLLKALPQLREEAARLPKTVDGSLTGLKNQATETVGAIDQITHFTARLSDQLTGLASPLKKVSDYLKAFDSKGFKGIGEVFDTNALADQAKFAQDRIAAVQAALEEIRQQGSVSIGSRLSLGTGDRAQLEAQLKVYQTQLARVQEAQAAQVQSQEESSKALERTYDERTLAMADSFGEQAKAAQSAASSTKAASDKAIADRKTYNLQMDVLDRAQSDASARRLAREEAAAQEAAGVQVDELALLKKYVAETGSTWDDYLKRQQERQRLELAGEKSRQDKLKAARAQATADLKAQLAQQTQALKDAQQVAEQVNSRTTDVLQPFKDAVKQPGVVGAGADYGTANAYKVNARQALNSGNTVDAVKQAQKALDVIQQIEQAGGNDYGLRGFKQELLDIATGAQELDKVRAADAVNQIQQSIQSLQEQLEAVKVVSIDFQIGDDTVAAVTARVKALAAELAKVMVIPTTIVGPSGTPVQAPTDGAPGTISTDTAVPVSGFAEGGWTGPGGKYQPAGVVHADEHVQPQEVVREPGALGFLERIRMYGFQNTMRALRGQMAGGWRGYATGGLVSPRMVPSIPQLSPALAGGGGSESMGTVVLQLDGRSYSMQAQADQFTALHRESLKKGHRRSGSKN